MTLSKLFIERVTNKKLLCSDIYHPGESCFEFNFYLIKKTWLHCAKFYAPIVLLPLVKKINIVQWTEVKKSLIFYVHMILGSYIPSILTIAGMCLSSKCLGRIYLPTFIYIPNVIVTMLYTPFMDQRVANIYANIMLMVNIEALIREGRTVFWQIIRDSKLIQMILFMMSSALVLDTMSTMPTNIFWFINPYKEDVTVNHKFVQSPLMDRILPTKSNNCKHKSSCDQYIWRGAKRISMTMFGFETLRVIFTNIKPIFVNPSAIPKILKDKMNFQLITMVSGYSLIFKISQCLQNRYHETPSRYSNLISGFLCGSVFWINADWSLLCHGLSAAIQLTFQNYFMSWLTSKNKSIANYVANFPWSKIFYTITIGYALHLVVLYPSLCSKFMHKISDMVLSYRFREIRKNTFDALCIQQCLAPHK